MYNNMKNRYTSSSKAYILSLIIMAELNTQSNTESEKVEESTSVDLPKSIDLDQFLLWKFNGDWNVDRYDNIIKSYCTYWKMVDALREIAREYTEYTEYFVLGVHYAYNEEKKNGLDTQSGFGGSIAFKESPVNAVLQEGYEETRLGIGIEKLKQCTVTKCKRTIFDKKIQKKKVVSFTSYIYSTPVTNCAAVQNWTNTAKDRKSDTYNKVGVIIYGTFQECLNIVSSIPVDNSDNYNDEIDGIVILPINKAIDLASSAKPPGWEVSESDSNSNNSNNSNSYNWRSNSNRESRSYKRYRNNNNDRHIYSNRRDSGYRSKYQRNEENND